MLTCLFEKIITVSFNEIDIDLLYCVSLLGCTCQNETKITDIRLQAIRDKDVILSLENKICGGIRSVMSDRYAVPGDKNDFVC